MKDGILTTYERSSEPPTGQEKQAARVEKRWPAIASLLTAWICPATTARRTNHVSLGRAWAVHWLVMILGTGLIVFLIVLDLDEDLRTTGRIGLLNKTPRVVHDITREFEREPLMAWSVVAGTVIGIELAFVVLAVLSAPWGARDEPMRASVANALRRTWLQTAHLLPIILAFGLWIVIISHASEQWWHRYQSRQSRPWYVKHQEAAYGYPFFVMLTWFLWGVFRSVGAARKTPPIDRPPTCETCGYNLTAASMEGRCPECGDPVLYSLGRGVRPGVLWKDWRALRRRSSRPALGTEPERSYADAIPALRHWSRRRVWLTIAWTALVRHRWFGRQIRTTTPTTDHRSFILLAIPPVFVIGAVGINLCYVADTGRNPLTREPEVAWVLGPLVGYLGVLFLGATALFAAWLAALAYYRSAQRNLLVATMQISAYLAAYLILWATFAASAAVLLFLLDELFTDISGAVFLPREVLAVLLWAGLNLIWLAGYVRLVMGTTSTARFANR